MIPHFVVDELSRRSPCWLRRDDDHRRFAYLREHDYIRGSDDVLWAHLSENVLLSARSGEPLAYQVGSAYYDYQTRKPIYYERR